MRSQRREHDTVPTTRLRTPLASAILAPTNHRADEYCARLGYLCLLIFGRRICGIPNPDREPISDREYLVLEQWTPGRRTAARTRYLP